MSRYWPSALLLAVLLGVLTIPLSARANDRHFAYTYESAVLAPGEKEIEVWTTYRNGRDTRYTRFDERLEFEIGLVPGLQTSFYVNLTAVGQDDGTGHLATSTEVSVSNEWKWRLLDDAERSGLCRQGPSVCADRGGWRWRSRPRCPEAAAG